MGFRPIRFHIRHNCAELRTVLSFFPGGLLAGQHCIWGKLCKPWLQAPSDVSGSFGRVAVSCTTSAPSPPQDSSPALCPQRCIKSSAPPTTELCCTSSLKPFCGQIVVGAGGGGCKPLLDEPTDSAGTYSLDLVVLLIESRALLIPAKHTITEQFIYTYI